MRYHRPERASKHEKNLAMPLIKRQSGYGRQRGTSLLEVLITIIILAFGLLGLAGLQSKIQQAELESYQRAQAALLLSDMIERISANRANAALYTFAGSAGTGDTQPTDCTSVAAGSARDICEWSNALKGASEKISSTNTGAMQGGRGCITVVQAPDPTAGVCLPGVYRVTVAWQGMTPTTASSLACGQGSYTPDTTRRAISSQITVGLPSCL